MTATIKPPLPERGINTASHAGFRVRGYTADQMHAYAQACADAAVAQERREIDRLRAALRDMLAPWDGFNNASETIERARAALGDQ